MTSAWGLTRTHACKRVQVAGLWIILAAMAGLSITIVLIQNMFHKDPTPAKQADANTVSVMVRPSPRSTKPTIAEQPLQQVMRG